MAVRPDCDLAIVGSGFGGSILAMIARRLGLRVALLERGRHPRFAIGESASPLAGVLIEQLADRYDLPRLRPLAAFGAWQRAYPEVTCGLKRGFTYFKHEAGAPYRTATDRSNQLLVAASPADVVSDTHWLRADVDAFLVREAMALGVEYLDEIALDGLEPAGPDGAMCLTGTRHGASLRLRARAMVDASGPRGFMSRVVGDGAGTGFAAFPPTQALFSHFTGVARCAEIPGFGDPDQEEPPYPVDDAALHHIFDGGWMWVLRFGNGVTSAGVAVTDRLAAELRLADGADAWRRLLARHPSVAEQFADAQPIRELTWMPRVAWRASAAAGPGWVRLPSAVASIDPLFSTGIPLTLLGIERVAGALEHGALVGRSNDRWIRQYNTATLDEAEHTAAFVAGCYAGFGDFEAFRAYSMFYFAAASHAEAARRVRPGDAGHGFLRAADPSFAAAMRRLSPAAGADRGGHGPGLDSEVAAAIEPVNVAGLCLPEKRNWYGVDVEDAVRGAAKLGASGEAVRAALSLPLETGPVGV
jgi:FADH2 O2-dependent halogenase